MKIGLEITLNRGQNEVENALSWSMVEGRKTHSKEKDKDKVESALFELIIEGLKVHPNKDWDMTKKCTIWFDV